MHCERARAALLEHLDQGSNPGLDAELQAHLTACQECTTFSHDLQNLQAQVRVWYDLTPPAWNPAPAGWTAASGWTAAARPGTAIGWRALVTQWLPVAASTAALLLAAGLFWRNQPQAPAETPVAEAPPAAAVKELLAASRQERQQDMEALTALLKAEMDRRSLETEESLKYVISHQIQSQRQLDALRERLSESPSPPEQY